MRKLVGRALLWFIHEARRDEIKKLEAKIGPMAVAAVQRAEQQGAFRSRG